MKKTPVFGINNPDGMIGAIKACGQLPLAEQLHRQNNLREVNNTQVVKTSKKKNLKKSI